MEPDTAPTANQGGTYGALCQPASSAGRRRASQACPVDWVEVLSDALLSDLKVLPRLAAELPTGGLPQAGYMAQHCYVICEALEHHLSCRSVGPPATGSARIDDQGGDGPSTATTELRGALGEVAERIDRLYSADRPGGLDRIEAHLWRLYRTAAMYLQPNAARSNPDPFCDGSMASGWWDGLGHRPRARIVAWAVVADPSRAGLLLRSQPLMTRFLVAAGWKRRARRRAERLGLPTRRPGAGLAS